MPANTATQGFTYPIAADRPCDVTATLATFATQLEAKGVSYDIDQLRTTGGVKRPFVRVSGTNLVQPAINPALGALVFDTVEANTGTPTDLSIFNGLVLPPGYWAMTLTVTGTGTIAGNQPIITINASSNTGPQKKWRDFGSGTSFTVSAQNQVQVKSGTSRWQGLFNYSGTTSVYTVSYAALEAHWLADALAAD